MPVPGVVRRVSSVSTITTRDNKDIKSIFGANVYHVPGLTQRFLSRMFPRLCLYICCKIIARVPCFHIFDFSEPTSRC